MHDDVGQHALLDRGANAACKAHAIDRAQVILVTTFLGDPLAERDAERRAEHRHFDVVGREPVPSKHYVDITFADQTGDQVARARMDQYWAAHQNDPPVTLPDFAQPLGDLADEQRLRLFARDAAAHERKDLRLRA